MLGLLHISEEIRKVDNAGRVGIAEFDTPLGFKNFRHAIAGAGCEAVVLL